MHFLYLFSFSFHRTYFCFSLQFDKRDMFLIYLYGRQHREGVNAYPIIVPHNFIAYQEAVERNLDQLPSEINVKLQYGDELTEIEEELNRGLSQIRIDVHRPPRERTHPLDERRRRRTNEDADSSMSMTSSTSFNSSLVGIDSYEDVSPAKRPRSEYSLPPQSSGSIE